MKTRLLALTLFSLFALNVVAQEKIKGNKNVTIIETEVEPFHTLNIGEKFEVVLREAKVPSVEIETDENLHDVIQFQVNDSTLSFKTTRRITSKKRLNITIHYTNSLRDVTLNDDAEAEALNTIEAKDFTLRINDYSKAQFNIKSDYFKLINNNKSRIKLSSKSRLNIESAFVELDLNESSKTDALITSDSLKVNMYQRANAKIEGSTNHINATLINSSDFQGKNLNADTCVISTEDQSDFSIQASDEISIEASGGSEIELYDNPKITIDKFTDTSKLIKKEL